MGHSSTGWAVGRFWELSLGLQQVRPGVISDSGSQGALADGVLAADRSLSVGTVCWAGLCVRLWCLQVMVSLPTNQVNSARGCTLGQSLYLRLCIPAVGADVGH